MRRMRWALPIVALGLVAGGTAVGYASADEGEAHGLVIGGDAGTGTVHLLDAAVPSWDVQEHPEAVRWSWQPTEENGYGDVLAGWDGAISDARVRRGGPGNDDRLSVLVTGEYGLMALVDYPSGERLWAADTGRVCGDDGDAPCGPHALELLPGDNVAVAASIGDFVRVYTSSVSPDSERYTEFELNGAHGVLWDPENELLWAVGTNDLVALEVGGTAEKPTLTERHRVALPGKQGGHDLAPVYGDTDELWVTTNDSAYRYSKSTDTFDTDFEYADEVNAYRLTKSIGNHPDTDQLLVTQAKKYDCPTTWCTPTGDFFGDGDLMATRTMPDARFYKLRWWIPAYQ